MQFGDLGNKQKAQSLNINTDEQLPQERRKNPQSKPLPEDK